MDDERVAAKSHDDEVLFDTLEARGEANVRADLNTNRWGTNKRKVEEWLLLKEEARRKKAADLSERSVRAAEASAEAAKRSARYAKIAWIVSGLSLLVSIVSLVWKR